MHAKAHSASQQILSETPNHGPMVIALAARLLVSPADQVVQEPSAPDSDPKKEHKAVRKLTRVPNTLTTRKPDEGAYLRLALKASQSAQRFPPMSVCYEVEDRSMPSVSSF